MPISLTAAADDDGRRLDRILRKALPDMPLSAIHRLLRKGCVLVDGEKAATDRRVKSGQTITLSDGIHLESPRTEGQGHGERPRTGAQGLRGTQKGSLRTLCAPCLREMKFENIILFEGVGLLVLNKPAGLQVHGKESLEDLVRAYLDPKLSPSLSFRPGPLHRLDRQSSGVIAFSTSLEGARFFSAMMRNRMIKKQYLALVNGVIEKDEIWEDELVRDERRKKTFRGASKPGEAKTALTRVSPLVGDGERTLILAEIETGRTHQIRAQAASRGHPLLGDRKYGGATYGDAIHGDGVGGDFLLHAWRMEFSEKTGEKTDNDKYERIPGGLPRRIEAPLPENFLDKIRNFFGEGIINKRLSHL